MVTHTRRLRTFITAMALTGACAPFALAEAAQAAPQHCRAWKIQGQTWFAHQSNGYSLMFTLRMGRTFGLSRQFYGHAQFNRGSVLRPGGTGSNIIRGGIGSDGIGYLKMDIAWANGSAGQYHARPAGIRRTSRGGLIAGLQGTTIDMTGTGAGARWWADGTGAEANTGGVYPLYCLPADVVR